MIWLRRILLLLLTLIVLLALALFMGLRGSLAQLDGQAKSGVSAQVEVSRDERGYVSVNASSQADAARALGFVHAQERFFQMDLMRRNAAGELAALVGAKALPLDKGRRIHRFRHRAGLALAALPAAHRALLDAYTAGVNEGLAALAVRPFEYGLLRQSPKPWAAADSLLVVLSMYLDLQGSQGRDDLATGALKAAVPPDWYAFLTQHSADWQAAIDGSTVTAVPIPASPWPPALGASAKVACIDCGLLDSRDIGSNNFAVSGARSPHGGAILADDMHLAGRVPGTWFKVQLRWSEAGRPVRITGLSLAGAPAVVVGSNGQIAWGFTNATADWTDVIALKLSADGTRYQSPTGQKPLVVHKERIEVAGGAAIDMEVKETEWGPVLAAPFDQFALRWVAHDVAGLNLRLLGLARASTVNEAVAAAAGAGLPAQNLLVVDTAGRIGWTLIGALPLRELPDLNTPQDWSTGANGWRGYVGADAAPKLIDPADGRLWSANARTVGGTALALIGNGGYDLGARGQQIRDGLQALPKLDEAALHAIQLDDRALFLQRWRKLLLDEVLTPDFVARNNLADYRRQVETSADAARVDAAGYTYVRAFRERVLEKLFAPLASLMESKQLKLRDIKMVPETPGWALLQARRADVLKSGTWQQLLEQAVLDSQKAVLAVGAPAWGEHNRLALKHPLSPAVPFLARWLDMPNTPMNGDRHMPRVQQPVHGQSQRMVVSPGREDLGILTIPAGQSGHPMSPFYAADHPDWLGAKPLPFLPGAARYKLILTP